MHIIIYYAKMNFVAFNRIPFIRRHLVPFLANVHSTRVLIDQPPLHKVHKAASYIIHCQSHWCLNLRSGSCNNKQNCNDNYLHNKSINRN